MSNIVVQLKTRCGCTQLIAVPDFPGMEYHVMLTPKRSLNWAAEADALLTYEVTKRTFQYRSETRLPHRDIVLTYEEVAE